MSWVIVVVCCFSWVMVLGIIFMFMFRFGFRIRLMLLLILVSSVCIVIGMVCVNCGSCLCYRLVCFGVVNIVNIGLLFLLVSISGEMFLF